MSDESIINKIVKTFFIAGISICSLISLGILCIYSAFGGNEILSQGGSDIVLKPILGSVSSNILAALGQSFIILTIDLSSLFLFFFIVIFWFCATVWILREEIKKCIRWIFGIRISIRKRIIIFPRFGEEDGFL